MEGCKTEGRATTVRPDPDADFFWGFHVFAAASIRKLNFLQLLFSHVVSSMVRLAQADLLRQTGWPGITR